MFFCAWVLKLSFLNLYWIYKGIFPCNFRNESTERVTEDRTSESVVNIKLRVGS